MISSRLSPKVEVRNESINGKGIFAKEDITKGEIVFIKGGHILTKDQIFSSGICDSYFPISDEYYLGSTNKEEEESIKLYQNHSCNPNVGLHGEITFVAMRDIKKDEELTVDYAFIDNENYSFECTCGSPDCRGTITGFDWKIKELQDKYYDYFAQYLKDKIDKERNDNNE
jgi:SET domain-containing protein